jgi:predicted oxidoreductase
LAVSIDGGGQVRWNPNGTELFYIGADDRLMSVPIRFAANGTTVEAGTPLGLFPTNVGSCGVPASTDGLALETVKRAGGRLINQDRMWHYTEGIANWNPVCPDHGIRILPGPSALWLDANGKRLPAPLFPGFDTLETMRHILTTGNGYSWLILNQHIIRKEFALSGSEQNPDLTGKNIRLVLGRAVGKRAMAPVEAFKTHGADFVVRSSLRELVAGMNAIPDTRPLRHETIEDAVRHYHRGTAGAGGGGSCT